MTSTTCMYRAARSLPLHRALLQRPVTRLYATTAQAGPSSRRQVTAINDDGSVQWKDLSGSEKAHRATQKVFFTALVLFGVVMTGAVGVVLYRNVFSPDSKTAHFGRAFDDIRNDPRAIELLGPASKMKAFGEPSWNRWQRNRPIASSTFKDAQGREYFNIRFYVEGSEGQGEVRVRLVRPHSGAMYEYETFKIDVEGKETLHLRNGPLSDAKDKGGFKFLGIRWK